MGFRVNRSGSQTRVGPGFDSAASSPYPYNIEAFPRAGRVWALGESVLVTRVASAGPWLLLGIVIAVSGCRKKPDLLVDIKERRAYQTRVEAVVKANAARRCPRPVLRGQAQDGTAAPDIIALVESAATTRGCVEAVRRRQPALGAALFYPSKQRPTGYPDRYVSRPFVGAGQGAVAVVAVARACGGAVKSLRRSVVRRDGCSPYRPGVRCTGQWIGVLRVAKGVAAQARLALINGRKKKGLQLLLDLLRLSQDLERGGTSWQVTNVAHDLAGVALPLLERALNETAGFTAALLVDVKRQLELLINSEPHPAGALRGEYLSMILETVLPQFAAKSWKPPGPGCAVKMAAPKANRRKRRSVEAWKDVWALHALVYEQIARDMGLVCPASASPQFCAQALQRLATRYKKMGARAFPRLQSRLSSATARRRDPGFFALMALPSTNARQVANQSRRRVALAGLLLSAAYRELVVARNACLGIAVFDEEPLKHLRRDPYSGRQLVVKQILEGRFLVRSKALASTAGLAKAPAIVISCR